MESIPVYVFDSRDTMFCKWPRFWFLREITENLAQYKGWKVVVATATIIENANKYVYEIGERAVFKKSYGGSSITITFAEFLREIGEFVRQYDWNSVRAFTAATAATAATAVTTIPINDQS